MQPRLLVFLLFSRGRIFFYFSPLFWVFSAVSSLHWESGLPLSWGRNLPAAHFSLSLSLSLSLPLSFSLSLASSSAALITLLRVLCSALLCSVRTAGRSSQWIVSKRERGGVLSIMLPGGKPRGRWVAWILPLAVGCMFEFAWSSRSPDGSSSLSPSLPASAFLSTHSIGNVPGAPAPLPPPASPHHMAPHRAEQSQQHHHHVPGGRHHLAPVAIYRSPASLRTGHGESSSPPLSSPLLSSPPFSHLPSILHPPSLCLCPSPREVCWSELEPKKLLMAKLPSCRLLPTMLSKPEVIRSGFTKIIAGQSVACEGDKSLRLNIAGGPSEMVLCCLILWGVHNCDFSL